MKSDNGEEDTPERLPNAGAVGWYMEQAERQLDERRERAAGLRERGGTLAGFAGVLLALVGANAADILTELGPCVRIFVGVLLACAITLLAASVAWTVLRVILPVRSPSISSDEVGNYASERFTHEPDLWRVQVRTLKGIHPAIEKATEITDEAGNALNVAAVLFVAGLFAAALALVILVIDSI